MTDSSKYKPKFVPKGWGHELWIVNKEEYCGKLLFIKKDTLIQCGGFDRASDITQVIKFAIHGDSGFADAALAGVHADALADLLQSLIYESLLLPVALHTLYTGALFRGQLSLWWLLGHVSSDESCK